ncbi:MAG: ATP-binding cassette domain-containing protein [Bacteroidota bacterium]|nr:ATP-binding cassette domain-containing protein [Bacteroidota bacterium]MDP4231353.1 ATP-binding cassette domain-containing protein [Bacteroidota bacterium]MDP4236528.1 ATP-binding cassette domain-containing protein [Bacteroidota bacterium]
MSDNDPIIARGLKKSFKNVDVLDGIDLRVERGTVLALLGPNGAGKTTTIRILSTLLPPDGGQALVNGFDVVREAKQVRRSIGLTGQYAAVDEYLTGRENLEMMGKLYHLSSNDSKRRAIQLLEEFDLSEAANRIAKTYSGGMRRRLDLALSLVATPPILFLDEPTTGLDPRSRLAIWDRIEKLVYDGTTILLTTQYLDEADKLADRIVVIDHGRVIAEGTSNELKSNVGNERLELVLPTEEEVRKTIEALRTEVLRQEDNRTITVAVDGSITHVKKILDLLQNSAIEVESFTLHKPTLDDVFLQLTGHEATAAETEEDKIK